jgi:SAM-dependent methyltransferase
MSDIAAPTLRPGDEIDERVIHDVDAFFRYQVEDNAKFWRRFGIEADVAGEDVLDLGCGHGALSLEVARRGARSVLGLDISAQRVAYAEARVRSQVPGVLAFAVADVRALPGEGRFDRVVSKDTFEHVGDVLGTLRALHRLLRPGGIAMLGFSPLWYSPFGDHGELGSRLPWAHVVAGEARVLAAFNARNDSRHASLKAAGFNMLTKRDFLAAFAASGLVLDHLAVNPSEGGLKGVLAAGLRVLSAVPGLDRYCAVGLYAVLRRPA